MRGDEVSRRWMMRCRHCDASWRSVYGVIRRAVSFCCNQSVREALISSPTHRRGKVSCCSAGCVTDGRKRPVASDGSVYYRYTFAVDGRLGARSASQSSRKRSALVSGFLWLWRIPGPVSDVEHRPEVVRCKPIFELEPAARCWSTRIWLTSKR